VGIIWGLIVVALSLLCWGGQVLSTLAPASATRLTLMESNTDVESTFWADIRGEAAWDSLTLWTMPVAGVLLIVDNPAWAYFGLVGGGMYLYFAGRGIFTRAVMQRDGLRIGAVANRTVGYAMLAVWGVMALIMLIAASVALTD